MQASEMLNSSLLILVVLPLVVMIHQFTVPLLPLRPKQELFHPKRS